MGQKTVNIKKFLFYLFRWQLSTPIIWLVVRNLGTGIWATIIANLIGGCIFFWVDKIIFRSNKPEIHYLKKGKCNNCHDLGDLYKTKIIPESLCAKCLFEKLKTLDIKSVKF
jgi:hypothetical protein